MLQTVTGNSKGQSMTTDKKSQIIHTRLKEDLFEKLKAKAESHDISVSQLVRLVLQRAAEPTTRINVDVRFDGESLNHSAEA